MRKVSRSPGSRSLTARRVPQQERGERRVAQLLEAAAAVIAVKGYESATMSAIADHAGAPIGSLYQFFPSKRAITHALRVEFGSRYEALLIDLEAEAASLSLKRLVARLIGMTVGFVESHPAFLALLDAPLSTRSPASLRNTLRQRLAACISAVRPSLNRNVALELATVTLQMIKGLNQLYGESTPLERKRLVREYETAITAYLAVRTSGENPK
jgi:AcrR family transcriptional regulator